MKVVSPLLPFLPRRHRYRVIFMDRPVDEVARSQLKLRAHRGESTPPDAARLREALVTHRQASLAFLKRSSNVATLVVPYPDLVASPSDWSARIARFLADQGPDADRMAAVVRPELYRNRSPELA